MLQVLAAFPDPPPPLSIGNPGRFDKVQPTLRKLVLEEEVITSWHSRRRVSATGFICWRVQLK